MPMYVFLSGSFVRPASWQTFLKILVLILFPPFVPDFGRLLPHLFVQKARLKSP